MDKKINWPLLASVRFFLAMVVLSEHLGWHFSATDYVVKLSKFSAFVAVLGFLVISGFSIAASYGANKEGFYFRRWLRIMPVYIACVVFTVIVTAIKQSTIPVSFNVTDILTIAGHFVFLQGVFVGSLADNPVLWTLMIEVFFYALTPFIDKRVKWVVVTIIFSAFIFALDRYLSFTYFSQMLYGLSVLFLGWAWLLGFWFYHNRDRSEAAFFLLSVGLMAIVINGHFSENFALLTWLLVCTSVCYGNLFKLPLQPVFNLLGDVSYPIYVFHVPFFELLIYFKMDINSFTYCLMALLFCFAIDQFYDKPLKTVIKKQYKLRCDDLNKDGI